MGRDVRALASRPLFFWLLRAGEVAAGGLVWGLGAVLNSHTASRAPMMPRLDCPVVGGGVMVYATALFPARGGLCGAGLREHAVYYCR